MIKLVTIIYDSENWCPRNVGYNFPPLEPQHEKVWDVGSQRLITLKSRPYFSVNPF